MINVIMGPESYMKKLTEYIDTRIKMWEKQQHETNTVGNRSVAPEFVLTELDILRDLIQKGNFDEEKETLAD